MPPSAPEALPQNPPSSSRRPVLDNTAELERKVLGFLACKARFEKLLPILHQFVDENVDSEKRSNFCFLFKDYVFHCESIVERSFFCHVLTSDDEVSPEAAYTALVEFRRKIRDVTCEGSTTAKLGKAQTLPESDSHHKAYCTRFLAV
ncbi:hypothetical protein FRB90_002848 [Tulasnella sp. 427]|nr:hypothetical protein FRB90_002848 [Tulasnella sp. 427]